MIHSAHDDVAQPPQSFGQEAQRDALAATRFAGDHHESAVAHRPLHPTAKGLHRRRHVKRFDRDLRTKRVKLQAEKGQQGLAHDSSCGRRVGIGT